MKGKSVIAVLVLVLTAVSFGQSEFQVIGWNVESGGANPVTIGELNFSGHPSA